MVKEPWEMTKREYLRDFPPKFSYEATAAIRKANLKRGQAARDKHAKLVKQAFSEGKPVPAEVLAEYNLAKITAENLVYSRTRKEIQDKVQQIFGSYEDLERMDRGEIPMTVEGDVSIDYMADIEYAAAVRDLEETRELLRRAYDEIAEGHAKGVLPAYRPSLVAELAGARRGQALQGGGVPNHNTVIEYDKRYSLTELEVMCKEKGLPTSGDKKTLIRRLLSNGRKS